MTGGGRIAAEYQKFHSAVIGPAIILSDDSKIVEARKIGERYKYQRERRNIIIAYLMLHIGVDITFLLKLCRKIVPLELKAYYPIEIKDKHAVDVVLQGCCWIFTPIYVQQFDGIDDRTFMYREEELLYMRLKKHNMQSLYSENLEIKHLGGATTSTVYNVPRKRKLFRYKNEIRSLKMLIDEMRGSEKIK